MIPGQESAEDPGTLLKCARALISSNPFMGQQHVDQASAQP